MKSVIAFGIWEMEFVTIYGNYFGLLIERNYVHGLALKMHSPCVDALKLRQLLQRAIDAVPDTMVHGMHGLKVKLFQLCLMHQCRFTKDLL